MVLCPIKTDLYLVFHTDHIWDHYYSTSDYERLSPNLDRVVHRCTTNNLESSVSYLDYSINNEILQKLYCFFLSLKRVRSSKKPETEFHQPKRS